MTTTTPAKLNRGWLKKEIAKGNIEAKCNYSYTDDYAFDNANDFGKTNWQPVRIRHPRFESYTYPNGSTIDRCVDDDRKEGYLNLNEGDFSGKSGGLYRTNDGEIRFYVHSNLSYTVRVKAS